MSLRTRIALSAAAAVLAAIALFAAGAYWLISERAYDRLDRSLSETADRVADELERPDLGGRDFAEPPTPDAPARPAPEPEPDPAGTRVELDPSGEMDPSGPRTVTLEGEHYRLLVRALEPGADGTSRTVAVARPLTDVEETLDEVALGLATAALVAALIATGLALLIVRPALRPLAHARTAAERVADSQDPSLRVPEGRADEVGGLARAMNRMLSRLEAAQRRLRSTLTEQRRFAADASHEMRTPLTALRGDIETLRRHDLPPPERAETLSDMAASVERLDRLVEGLLGLARVDGETVEAEPVDLGEMLAEIATADECASLDAGVVVRGDRAALRGMLMNLIDNARTHGGRVSVAVAAENGSAVVRVDDDGPGIAPADRERVFDRFYRAPDRRGTPGAGLGLPIAKATAERWGGSLRLLSSGTGTSFEVRLPLA
ncbi:MAG TPA: HAMP domain-containing sensor histidine kinase [Miltoncostaeaceae bacterium]|nr:HAMP domain-containing sensor histidine kinase [Miltoncostaeaceae bacterium]